MNVDGLKLVLPEKIKLLVRMGQILSMQILVAQILEKILNLLI